MDSDSLRVTISRMCQERKLLSLRYQDQISEHIYADEQTRVRRQRAAADDLLQRHQVRHETILGTLDHALQLTDNIQAAYLQADSTERRLFNQALFETLAIDTEEIDEHQLAPPFVQLASLNQHYEQHAANGRPRRPTKKRTPDPAKVRGSDVQLLVDLTGLEPEADLETADPLMPPSHSSD